jgi:predicted flavoprotein YhiN
LRERLSEPRGSRSIANHLKKAAGLEGIRAGLLYEILEREDFNSPERVAEAIKKLPLTLISARPLEEAISSAGGVVFEELDNNLMLRKYPGMFCAGEMLDWEAPTGGYLLTACFASGRWAGKGAADWLSNLNNLQSGSELH